ncbi:MAG: hypothetical protein ACLUHF_06980 [Faecalitalea cylindroides]
MGSKKDMIATEEYHNTILLLKQYRMMKFQADLKKKQYEKKTSFDNILSAKLEQEWAEIQLNDMLLNDIITALNFVKDYPSEGELYYYILYYTYFADKTFSDEMIASLLEETNVSEDISRATLNRKRKKATEVYGMILWGFLGKESPVFQQFLKLLEMIESR